MLLIFSIIIVRKRPLAMMRKETTMTKEDLRSYAMYGLSVLFDKSFQDYRKSDFTDEKTFELCQKYDKLWNELYNEELEEATKDSPMSL